jgi:hypothetical protein
MATFTKINDWILNLSNADIDINADTLQFKLTNTAFASETPNPTTDTNGIAANATDISYTNYTDDMTVDRVLEGVSSTQTAGVYTLDANDIVITASGGALATFQYLYLFDQTGATPVDPLMGAWDHGSAISLANGEAATITWNASGIYTIT